VDFSFRDPAPASPSPARDQALDSAEPEPEHSAPEEIAVHNGAVLLQESLFLQYTFILHGRCLLLLTRMLTEPPPVPSVPKLSPFEQYHQSHLPQEASLRIVNSSSQLPRFETVDFSFRGLSSCKKVSSCNILSSCIGDVFSC
jgi:hypothetical protein